MRKRNLLFRAAALCVMMAAVVTAYSLVGFEQTQNPDNPNETPISADGDAAGRRQAHMQERRQARQSRRKARKEEIRSAAELRKPIVNPRVIYSYEQMASDIAALEQRYPSLISSYVIGTTVDGRDIPAFNLGRGKREVIICASMHACEHITTNFVMYMTEKYCEGYMEDGEYDGISYRTVLDNVKFLIVPMANPDGVSLAQFGASTASNPDAVEAISGENRDYSSWKANINGVDLNGNFRWKWGTRDEVTEPCEAGYTGPYAASEPETQALIQFMDSSDYYMLSSMHIRGEVIYWIDSDTEYLYSKYYPVAKRFADAFGYALMGAEDVSDRGGYMVNSERVTKGKYCMTVEMCSYIGTDPYPPERFDAEAADVYPMALIMGDEAMKMEQLSVAPDIIYNDKVLALYGKRPKIVDGCLMAEAFDILERCGVTYVWYTDEGKLELYRGGKKAVLWLDGLTMEANELPVRLTAPMTFTDGVLMLPVLDAFTAVGMDADWDAENLNLTVSD